MTEQKTYPSDRKRLALVMMLAASICFSTGGLFMKLIPWNPLAINGARNLVACVVIGIYLIVIKHKLVINPTVLIGALCMAGVTTGYAVANKLTTAGNTIILQYTAPIWIMIMVYFFFGKKPSTAGAISILIVLAGILCFFFEGMSTGRWLGDAIALLSGVFYAGVFMLNSFEKGDALSSVFLGQLLCGIVLSPLILKETDFSAPVLWSVFFLGAVQVGLAYIFFTYGTKYIDPLTASIINAIEPILNPLLVALFYGEMLGPLSFIGAAIVLFGILYYNIKGAESGTARH